MKNHYKVVIYGPAGIGKTDWATHLPKPLLINVKEGEAPSNWVELMDVVNAVRDTPDVCQTLILNAADSAEALCVKSVREKGISPDVDSIAVKEKFGQLLNVLTEINRRGIHVVIIAPAVMRKMAIPECEGGGTHDHWDMNLSKHVNMDVKKWCDTLLFCNRELVLEKGPMSLFLMAKGVQPVIYTKHRPECDAKNSCGMPDKALFTSTALAEYFDPIDIPEDLDIRIRDLAAQWKEYAGTSYNETVRTLLVLGLDALERRDRT